MNGLDRHIDGRPAPRRVALVLVAASLLILVAACQDPRVSGDYRNPYTPEQVTRMMSYHGALVARFDGRQWWFLSGKRWIKLDNAKALDFALAASRRRDDHPVL